MAKSSAKKLATNRRKQWQTLLQQPVADAANGNRQQRIVIDTNVWFSGLLYGEQPEEVIRWCLRHSQLVTSDYLISELRLLLKQRARAPYKWLNFLEQSLKQICELIEVDESPAIVRDPKDDPVIATALKGNCTHLITGDKDLLELGTVGDLQIVTVNQFLKAL